MIMNPMKAVVLVVSVMMAVSAGAPGAGRASAPLGAEPDAAGRTLRVLSLNVHSRWEREIVERTVRQVNEQLTGRDLACGDWNTGLRSIEAAGLQMQSARAMLGAPETDTFTNFTKAESHGAIDHFFVNGLTPVSYLMITDGYGCSRISDHWPIVLDIQL